MQVITIGFHGNLGYTLIADGFKIAIDKEQFGIL